VTSSISGRSLRPCNGFMEFNKDDDDDDDDDDD
jgi:hypothetical protein